MEALFSYLVGGTLVVLLLVWGTMGFVNEIRGAKK